MYDDYKIKPLHVRLPKTRAFVKSYDSQTKWMCFLIEDDELLENIKLVGTKSAQKLKKKLIANLLTLKNFENENKILR